MDALTIIYIIMVLLFQASICTVSHGIRDLPFPKTWTKLLKMLFLPYVLINWNKLK